jgi:EmrB/QacA subfamily drug resistance transporter
MTSVASGASDEQRRPTVDEQHPQQPTKQPSTQDRSGPETPRDAQVPASAWRALAVGAAGFVLFGFNSTATNLAFGAIADSFSDVPESIVSWVASGYFIASAAFLPLGGRLADRLGRRRVFNAGLVGFAIFAVGSAVAPTIWVLIASRIGQAMAGALVIPASLAMALPGFPIGRRSSAVATWAAAGPLASAVAPSAAAALLQVSSWRWVYFLSAPFALAVFATSLVFVSKSKAEEDQERLDLVGTALATASIALLIIGISNGPGWGLGAPQTLGCLFAAVAFGVGFLFRSTRHPAPLLNLALLRIPEVAVANLANLLMSITSLSIWLIWPLWLGRVWGYSTSRVGLAITIGPICAASATLLGGRLADRYGQRWLMIFGSGLATCAVLWSFFMFGAEPDYVREFLPMIVGFGIGWGISNPSMNSWALSTVPQAVFGEVNASFNTIRNLGGAIGVSTVVAIIGPADRPDVLDAYDRANLFFATTIGLSCLTVAIGTYIISRSPSRVTD